MSDDYADPRWDKRATRDQREEARADSRFYRRIARAKHRARREPVTVKSEARRLGIPDPAKRR